MKSSETLNCKIRWSTELGLQILTIIKPVHSGPNSPNSFLPQKCMEQRTRQSLFYTVNRPPPSRRIRISHTHWRLNRLDEICFCSFSFSMRPEFCKLDPAERHSTRRAREKNQNQASQENQVSKCSWLAFTFGFILDSRVETRIETHPRPRPSTKNWLRRLMIISRWKELNQSVSSRIILKPRPAALLAELHCVNVAHVRLH